MTAGEMNAKQAVKHIYGICQYVFYFGSFENRKRQLAILCKGPQQHMSMKLGRFERSFS
jgi:hypothetical protein